MHNHIQQQDLLFFVRRDCPRVHCIIEAERQNLVVHDSDSAEEPLKVIRCPLPVASLQINANEGVQILPHLRSHDAQRLKPFFGPLLRFRQRSDPCAKLLEPRFSPPLRFRQRSDPCAKLPEPRFGPLLRFGQRSDSCAKLLEPRFSPPLRLRQRSDPCAKLLEPRFSPLLRFRQRSDPRTQLFQPPFSPLLRFRQRSDPRAKLLEPHFSPLLQLSESLHKLRQSEQFLAEDKPPQFSAPLRVLLEQSD